MTVAVNELLQKICEASNMPGVEFIQRSIELVYIFETKKPRNVFSAQSQPLKQYHQLLFLSENFSPKYLFVPTGCVNDCVTCVLYQEFLVTKYCQVWLFSVRA